MTREKTHCRDCGVEPGEFHEPGCDIERCPFCGGQLLSCSCAYKQLGPFYGWDHKPFMCVHASKLSTLPPEYTEVSPMYREEDGTFTYMCSAPNYGLPTDVYNNGLSDKHSEHWEAILEDQGKIPWSGEWPGEAECRENDLWCYWGPDFGEHGWVECDKDHPGAREDLNRLGVVCKWDRAQKKFVKR